MPPYPAFCPCIRPLLLYLIPAMVDRSQTRILNLFPHYFANQTSSLPQEARRNGEMKEIQNILADKSCMVVDPCFFSRGTIRKVAAACKII
jgi:precorrin-6B methylase 1